MKAIVVDTTSIQNQPYEYTTVHSLDALETTKCAAGLMTKSDTTFGIVEITAQADMIIQ